MNWIKLAIAACALVGFLAAGPAGAYVFLDPQSKWHDPAHPIPYRLNTFQDEPTVPGNEEFTDLRQSFTNWDVVAGARLSFVEGPEVTTYAPCAFTTDGDNVLSFRDCGNACTGNCIAATLVSRDLGVDYGQGPSAHLRIYDADIVFGRQWAWITLPTAQQQGCSGRMIVQSIATHEIGHLVGLGHSPIFGATMYASTTYCDQNPASLHADDIAGTVALYDQTLQEYQIGVHDVNQVRLGVTNCGNVALPSGAILSSPATPGATGIGGGAGWVFPAVGGVNHLYEGSFIMAREAPNDTAVSDDFRVNAAGVFGPQDADFLPLTNLTLLTPGVLADQESISEFNDSAANRTGPPSAYITPGTTPIGIRVRQESYAWASAPDNKYVILLYRLTNTTGSPIANLNAGLILDVDFTALNYSTNSVAYDAVNRLGYVSDPSTPNRLGVRVLNSEGTRSFRSLIMTGVGQYAFNNSQKALWMASGLTQTSAGPADIGLLICTGPFTIPAGQTVVAAFGLCNGTSQNDLVAASQAAQQKYDTVLSGGAAVEETAGVVGPVYTLKQNVPNPFNPATRIAYTVPAAAVVTLKVYNLAGQLVRTLVDGPSSAGGHEVIWDGRDDAGQSVASGTYFYELRADGELVQSRKMQLMK